MYRNKRHRPRRGGRRGNGGFRIKTFDPSHIVNNANSQPVVEHEEYEPNHAFSDFAISEKIKVNIAKRGFTTPTPIQDQAIPEILNGKDVVGIANTGTGKTAAFLIPLINKIYANRNSRTLIIAPTRELAIQIEKELQDLVHGLGIYSAICIGGVSIRNQINRLQRRPHFVIGTPGRLLDLNERKRIHFRNFDSIVLDEVDRMLDMGFIKDIQKIITQLPRVRQSLFFSATIGDNVLEVMKQFTQNPVKISIKSQRTTANVDQEIIKVAGRSKVQVLQRLLDDREFVKVLVFGRTKRGADKLSKILARDGFRVSSIHGNKSQNQRQRSLEMFRNGKVNILIATDVVARGIDVENITHVINYELPETHDQYLHRIGRTGRAGRKGKAYTFVN